VLLISGRIDRCADEPGCTRKFGHWFGAAGANPAGGALLQG
jgi:hypothetical protein